MAELMHASRQWAERPADQRFWTLGEMREKCRSYADASRDVPVYLRDVTAVANGDELCLVGRSGTPATLTNYAFHQLAGTIKAPGGYLASLPVHVAADCVNEGLSKASGRDDERRMLVHQNGGIEARCIVSNRYKRVWNWEVCDRLLTLGQHWRNPPAWSTYSKTGTVFGPTRQATEADIIPGVSIVKVGDQIQPSGLYASDRDMFAFLVNTQRVIDGSPKGLSVGFFVWNSEVGDKSLGLLTFAFDYVCGNHIVWGASDVRELRMRHVGDILSRSRTLVDAAMYADQQAGAFEAKIKWARSYEIAAKPEDVISEVVKRLELPRRTVANAYEIAERNADSYGSPRNVWGMVSGLTQAARDLPHADSRNALDVKAGQLLDAF